MAAKHNKPHGIMISLPYQGHITPFVNLALKLASKGFTITFAHLEFIHHKLSKAVHNGDTTNHEEVDFFSGARKSGLDIRYTTISDGFPLEFDRDLHQVEYWESLLRDFPARVDEFIGNIIKSDQILVSFLVVDTVFSWPSSIAKNNNLVNVSFWTQSALVFSLIYHYELLRENGHFPCKDGMEEEINYIPGLESINTKDFMPYLSEAEFGTIMQKAACLAFDEVKNADFILHNIVHEMESSILLALNKYQPNYAIGPINFSTNLATNKVSKSLRSESDCTHWLDSKSPGSVLYVSFGSFVHISKQVIEEIAYGLLLSEVNFIWVIRDDIVSSDDTYNVLPDGFEDGIKDKGLIIPWCNQIAVLSNQAVGGFMTHCGWNSTVESMWFGVPMICYPISYDQPTNRKLVVDDWKIGISLCDGKSVDRNEVAEKIKSFMSGIATNGLRQEANKVKEILRNAMEIGGSSDKNFDQFIDDLKAKIRATSE